jgi:DNA polymerase-3 subunit gamma/tau
MAAFYLKYRPQKIAELDLVAVKEVLTKVLQRGQKPHAFLFCGPKGTGKTSAARILAKAVNCLKNKGVGEPCNQCEMCKEITEGRSIDFYEIDGASNRGIDDIRELREKIKLAPARAQKKVYIIDEVHMLTTEAFNALLKTLEEPPEHAIFILCTTVAQKLPETIISRCMRFNFKKANVGEIVSSLRRVVGGEKLKVDDEALTEIAKAASGSFRDGTKILEQASLTGEKITALSVRNILGELESFNSNEFLKLLVKREAKNAVLWIGEAVHGGVDLKMMVTSLIETLRKILLKKIGVPEEIEEAEEIGESLTTEEVKKLIGLLSLSLQEMGGAVIPQLPLEMAIVEWCDVDLGEKMTKKTGKAEETEETEEVKAAEEEKRAVNQGGDGKVDFLEVEKKWGQVLLGLRSVNHSVEALLRSCRPANISGDLLTIEVFYKFHKERLETMVYRKMVEKAVFDLFGRPLKLKWILKEKIAKKKEEEENISGKKVEDDIIKAAEEIFAGEVD